MKPSSTPYPADSAGSIMSTQIPICSPTTTCGEALKKLAQDVKWDDIHHLYIIDGGKKRITSGAIIKLSEEEESYFFILDIFISSFN